MTGGSDESISNDSTHRIPAGRWMDWAKARGWAVDYGLAESHWPDVESRLRHEPSCFLLRCFRLWDDRFLRTGEAEMDGLEVRLAGTIGSFDEIDPDWHTGLATVRLRNARDPHNFAARTGLSVRPLARHISYPHSLVFSIQVFSQALLEAIKWVQGQKRGISRAAPRIVVELRSGDTPLRLNTAGTTKAPAGEGEIAGAGETNGTSKATETAPAPQGEPQTSKTLAAFLAAVETGEDLSPKGRLEKQIGAWLEALWKEHSPGRPNLSNPTIQKRWDAELRARGIILQNCYDLCPKKMRGAPGKRNRP